MSYVGAPYDYDLFVSYSHGAAAADPKHFDGDMELRDWTRAVAARVAYGLRLGFSDGGSDFQYYLDGRDAQSGDPLEADVQAAVKSSALMLIFMSPTYRDRDWCRNEVRWFFEQAATDGRGQRHVVLRVVVDTSNSTGRPWPQELCEPGGKTVNRGEPLFDPTTNLPIELLEGASGQKFTALNPLINRLIAEVKVKLEALRAQLTASRPATPTPPPPMAPPGFAAHPPGPAQGGAPRKAMKAQVYLENYSDPAAWQQVRNGLSGMAIVSPPKMEPDAPGLSLMTTYYDRRKRALVSCQGMILVRNDPDDDTYLRVSSRYADRKVLLDADGYHLPWVLIDGVPDEGPDFLASYDLPRVSMSEEDWAKRALTTLGLA